MYVENGKCNSGLINSEIKSMLACMCVRDKENEKAIILLVLIS
jgi:hypothetical protein